MSDKRPHPPVGWTVFALVISFGANLGLVALALLVVPVQPWQAFVTAMALSSMAVRVVWEVWRRRA